MLPWFVVDAMEDFVGCHFIKSEDIQEENVEEVKLAEVNNEISC